MEKKPLSALSDQELEELSKRYTQELMKYKRPISPESENMERSIANTLSKSETAPELSQSSERVVAMEEEIDEIDLHTPGQMEMEQQGDSTTRQEFDEINLHTPGQMEIRQLDESVSMQELDEIDLHTPGQMEAEGQDQKTEQEIREEIDFQTPGQMRQNATVPEEEQELNRYATEIENQLEEPGSVSSTDLSDIGQLRVRVFAARRALPLAGASVSISQIKDGEKTLLWVLRTDANGLTPMISLPAPDRKLAEKPGDVLPYVNYVVRVDLLGFYPIVDNNAQIFGGSSAIMPLEMQPLPENEIGTNNTVITL